jgi:hypothetical protein
MTSERKCESNRKNALRSTGPKTAKGKQNMRGNAIKFGIYSKLLLPGESKAELRKLIMGLREDLKAKGPMQEELFAGIVDDQVALRRLRRQERVYLLHNQKRAALRRSAEEVVLIKGKPVKEIEEAQIAAHRDMPLTGEDLDEALRFAVPDLAPDRPLADIERRRQSVTKGMLMKYAALQKMQESETLKA